MPRASRCKVAEGKAKDKRGHHAERGRRSSSGPQKYFSEVAERTGGAGRRDGLAWTPVGGDILFIEATKMPGKGKLILTGQLGDVMKESAQAALSFIRARAELARASRTNFLEKTDIHVHVPAGAIPKDGPSAGVTMFTALVVAAHRHAGAAATSR